MKNLNYKKILKDVAAVTAASFLSAWALHSFINPNGFVGGGFGGIATLLEAAGLMKSYVAYFLLNAPALICALIMLKGEFTVKTVICTALTSVIMSVMDTTGFFRFTGDRLLAAVYSGILYGVATGIIFDVGGSTGGTEIIAKIMVKKRPTMRPAAIIFAFDVAVILIGLVIFDIWSVVYAIICAFAFERSFSLYAGRGAQSGVYYIITAQPDALLATINAAAPLKGYCVQAKGGYTGLGKSVVKVLLPAGKVAKLRSVLKDGPTDAFAFVAPAVKVQDGGTGDE